MSFKDLTTRAAAILKSKPEETSKEERAIKASETAAQTGPSGPKKTRSMHRKRLFLLHVVENCSIERIKRNGRPNSQDRRGF